MFVWLCLDMLAVYIVSLNVAHDSWYAISSTHWVAHSGTTSAMTKVATIKKTVLLYPCKQGKACSVWLSRCINSVPTKDPSLLLYITLYKIVAIRSHILVHNN